MLLPASPMAHFIVGQTGFALAALEAFFDALGGLGYPGQFPPRRLGRSVGQIRIDLHHLLVVAVTITDHHHQFLVALLTIFGADALFAGLREQRRAKA